MFAQPRNMLEKDVGGMKKKQIIFKFSFSSPQNRLNQVSLHTNFKETHLCHIRAQLRRILTF